MVLTPGVFAFVLDKTKGNINTLCGPMRLTLSFSMTTSVGRWAATVTMAKL